jgi:hypothetical protein
VGDLPLQVGEVDLVAVDQGDPPDPGRAEEEATGEPRPPRR